MRSHLLLFVLCALLGVPIGATGVAYALSCAESAVRAQLEPVEITVDGEPVELDAAPSDPAFSRAESGRASFTASETVYVSLEEGSR